MKKKKKKKYLKVKKKKKIKNLKRKKNKKIKLSARKKKTKFYKFKSRSKSRSKSKTKETFRKIVRFGSKFQIRFKFKFNIDKFLVNFFQGISDKIETFKQVIDEEKEKRRKEKIKQMQKEKLEKIRENKLQKKEELLNKLNEIKEEKKMEKIRKIELKRFIRIEQAEVRKEYAEKQRQFYEKIRLEKKIEQFRKREVLEIRNLEKFVLNQERQDYALVQEKIEQIKLKYQAIRDQKIKERIEQLGIEVSDNDSRSDLLEKERQFNLAREKIEYTLESFYRSMSSCIFQLNRKWLPKKMSLLRVVDRRYETSEILIKFDEEVDDNWLMLVYLKDNNPSSNIIVEDKTSTEKNISTEYKTNEIFRFSDALVDSLTAMIDREYNKKIN
tara:strand:- start:6237 stop:7391 length:1155 start_codon:yes stop_codon:yes gene_type:complete